jgi:hypothetical protein
MKSSDKIEELLARFGSDWPADGSIVERVMQTIESKPHVIASYKRRRILMRSLAAVAASLLACVALWWTMESNHNSLYAQVINAVHKARTIHITYYQLAGGEAELTKFRECWYESGVGFRRDRCNDKTCRTVCVGNKDTVWTIDENHRNTVICSGSRGITKETEQIFADVDRHARDLQASGRRWPEGDRTFDGEPCKAYLQGKPDRGDRWSMRDKRRQLFYLDPQSRLVRVDSQERTKDLWNTVQINTINYDEPFSPAIFEPKFGKDFKVIDADARPFESTTPQGPVLVYDVENSTVEGKANATDMSRILNMVEWRLNGGSEKLAVVQRLDDQRIKIALLRSSNADLQRVK